MSDGRPQPKRHHWWPQLQSGRWCDHDGKIHVVANRGGVFRTTPINIGVEGHLYTRHSPSGPDQEIERWFSESIEGPFDRAFDQIFDFSRIQRSPHRGNRESGATAKALGFIINDYSEALPISSEQRRLIAHYAASLLVRNPHYLAKVREYHASQAPISAHDLKTAALDNMIHLFQIYADVIVDAAFCLVRRTGSSEFIFSDTGIVADEPWSPSSIPFDIHLPLTPDFSLEIFPLPGVGRPDWIMVGYARNQGVARLNRIVVGHAKRFVFTRSSPPLAFIQKNFGVPAPQAHAHRIVNGQLEVMYDRAKDRD